MTQAQRTATIDAILRAARVPCPRIVPIRRLRHKTTGRVYGIGGVPVNMDRAELEVIQIGFAYMHADGTTYSAPPTPQTEEQAKQMHEDRADRNAAEFRVYLVKMSEADLNGQAAYWLKG
ncbi:MAG TPA: hypothetical protein VM238_18535 [Phycisphaerae bacterium]|nr:hypothetical protein [Phycisphaerae bacterium]